MEENGYLDLPRFSYLRDRDSEVVDAVFQPSNLPDHGFHTTSKYVKHTFDEMLNMCMGGECFTKMGIFSSSPELVEKDYNNWKKKNSVVNWDNVGNIEVLNSVIMAISSVLSEHRQIYGEAIRPMFFGIQHDVIAALADRGLAHKPILVGDPNKVKIGGISVIREDRVKDIGKNAARLSIPNCVIVGSGVADRLIYSNLLRNISKLASKSKSTVFLVAYVRGVTPKGLDALCDYPDRLLFDRAGEIIPNIMAMAGLSIVDHRYGDERVLFWRVASSMVPVKSSALMDSFDIGQLRIKCESWNKLIELDQRKAAIDSVQYLESEESEGIREEMGSVLNWRGSPFQHPFMVSTAALEGQLNARWAVKEKFDGIRYMMYATGQDVYLIPRYGNVVWVRLARTLSIKVVLDLEIVFNNPEDFYDSSWKMIDALFVAKNITSNHRKSRLISALEKTKESNVFSVLAIELPLFYNYTEANELVTLESNLGWEGFVLARMDVEVLYGRSSNELYWKPIKDRSIDVEIKINENGVPYSEPMRITLATIARFTNYCKENGLTEADAPGIWQLSDLGSTNISSIDRSTNPNDDFGYYVKNNGRVEIDAKVFKKRLDKHHPNKYQNIIDMISNREFPTFGSVLDCIVSQVNRESSAKDFKRSRGNNLEEQLMNEVKKRQDTGVSKQSSDRMLITASSNLLDNVNKAAASDFLNRPPSLFLKPGSTADMLRQLSVDMKKKE